jgi:hypothetical protein
MVKPSSPNVPNTWLIFLCPLTHAQTSESHTFIRTRERERQREREKIHCKCTMQSTVHFIITLFNVLTVLLCVIYQLNFTYLCMLHEYHVIYIAFGIIRGFTCRSHWRRSTAARLLRSWVRIPRGAWFYVCCVLGLCDELITRPEVSYRLWQVVVCDQETSWTRRS